MPQKKIAVLVARPGEPLSLEAVVNELTPMQALVGGYIEVIRLDNRIVCVCDEEGAVKQLPVSVKIGDKHTICGPCFFARSTPAGNFASLTDKQVTQLYDTLDRPPYARP